ncbi:prepilin-type N-terminal cleavage/methylation domain-containing protein [Pseudoalteromonas sp. CNC9-20]|uniref:type IV pilus modification PilV family protein n=1 Tax=Pseudoalteromonas sp. CNC9-20 TaxID=2917750 RepID=UPI001EF66547|nr:prepilin-type N-terminal cleavage/methylation domain-containing protein [Pseudoalteromonas sp. CNC9-20]MCG7570399.1 prepilin-type N-terminal cleavage/methylation domain-containing protein [Pseudoalteromonas sp. CNC9-20]
MAVKRPRARGFTLVELILGIVIFAIAMVIVFTLIAPQARQSAEPLVQVKAAKLGQSLMNEILGKAYDENSDRSPPFQRCDEKPVGCTLAANLGEDTGESDSGNVCGGRVNYDDVDDYIDMPQQPVCDAQGSPLLDYGQYRANVSVVYDQDYTQSTSDTGDSAKRVDISVFAPNGEVYRFQIYRGNY